VRTAPFVLILCWSAWLCAPGIEAFSTPDDGMNLAAMHKALDTPWTEDLRGALLAGVASYRPAGGLFYRAVYSVFGFHARPFRIAAHVLLLLNLVAAYWLFRLLTGSAFASMLALIPLGFHPAFIDFYTNTGTVYDLLCFLFYSLSLGWLAILWRRGAGWAWYVGPLALQCAALGSKETAVSLPAAALILLLPHGGWARGKELALRLAPLALVSAVYAAVKLSPAGGMITNPSYRPEVSAARLIEALRHYAGSLLIGERGLNPAESIALFGAFVFSALALRSYTALRLAGCAVVALLPVAFIDFRAPFAAWIACAFACAALGALMGALLDHLPEARRCAAAAVLAALITGLYTVGVWPWRARVFEEGFKAAAPVRATAEAIGGASAELPPRSRTLVLDLPLDPSEQHTATFFARLLLRDPEIELVRSPALCAPPYPECAAAFRFSGSALGRLPADSDTSGNLR
jgi:hypothetical protein